MISYIIKRLFWAVVLLLVVSFLTFCIFSLLPATDPAQLRAGKSPTPELIAAIRESLGLDRPWYVQYFEYIKELVTKGNFGYSFQNGVDVREALFGRLPASVSLAIGGAFVWLLVGIPIGILCAVKRGRWVDRIMMGGALLAISAPVYWLGLVATYFFSSDIGRFPIFPATGTYVPLTSDPIGWGSSLLLPWLVLATAFAAVYARFVRSSLSEVLTEDYIRTAKAKGLSERKVILRHGMRSAITPVITIFGLDLGILMGGAILTESVFNIPGVGRYTFDAIQKGDIPTVQGAVLLLAVAIIVANLLVDIAYAFVDPRVRYS